MNDRELRSLLSTDQIKKGTLLHVDGHLFNVGGPIWAYFETCAYFDQNDMWSPVHVSIKANFGDMGGWEEAVCFATDILDYMNWEMDKSWDRNKWEEAPPQFHKKTHIFDKQKKEEPKFELNDVGRSILFTNKCPPGLNLNLDRPLPPIEPPPPPPTRLVREGQIPKRPKPSKFPPDSYDEFPFKSHGTY